LLRQDTLFIIHLDQKEFQEIDGATQAI